MTSKEKAAYEAAMADIQREYEKEQAEFMAVAMVRGRMAVKCLNPRRAENGSIEVNTKACRVEPNWWYVTTI